MADREEKPTVALDPRTITGPSWPVAIATLEQTSPQAVYALRIGHAALLRQVAQQMTAEDAGPELVEQAQRLLDALRHMMGR